MSSAGEPPSSRIQVQAADGTLLAPLSHTPERRLSASPASPWSSAPFPLERGLVDTRIKKIRPLIPPACLLEELPTPIHVQAHIIRARTDAHRIIQGEDERLIVVIGPCSIHDPAAAIEYANKLLPLAKKYENDLLVVGTHSTSHSAPWLGLHVLMLTSYLAPRCLLCSACARTWRSLARLLAGRV